MSNTRKKHKVFVYGTLRPRGVEATHTIEGWDLFNYYDRFPYIKSGRGVVCGNLLEVTTKQLNKLDHIEGIAHGLFQRTVVSPVGAEGVVEAFAYVAGNIAPQPIQSGDWFNREG